HSLPPAVAIPPPLGTRLVVGTGHPLLGLAQAVQGLVDTARRKDTVLGDDVEVPCARILRKIAHPPRRADAPTGGQGLARQDLGTGGLARTVPYDQPDPF